MSRFPYYKRFQSNALRGMRKLTLEQRGAYNTLLDLIYENAGPIEDDEREIVREMNCTVRVWRRLKAELIVLGKIYVALGMISNERATKEIFKLDKLHDDLAEAGAKGGRERARRAVRDRVEDASDPLVKPKKRAAPRAKPQKFAENPETFVGNESSNSEAVFSEDNDLAEARLKPGVKQDKIQNPDSSSDQRTAESRTPPAPLIGVGVRSAKPAPKTMEEQRAALTVYAEAEARGEPPPDNIVTLPKRVKP